LFLWQPALEGYQEQRHITRSHCSPQPRPVRQRTLAISTKVLAAALALSVKCGELEEDVPHSKNHIVQCYWPEGVDMELGKEGSDTCWRRK